MAKIPEKIVSLKITKPISFSDKGLLPARINRTKVTLAFLFDQR